LLGQIESDHRVVIADMEAGLGTLTRMKEDSLDRALLVLNPNLKSIEVARRAREIIAKRKITGSTLIVGNRLRGEEDVEQVHAALGDADLVAVPEDPAIRTADFQALSPVDAAPHSPAVQELVALARSWARPTSRVRPQY